MWDSSYSYVHEHITLDRSSIHEDLDFQLHDEEASVEEFRHLRALGVGHIIDVTPLHMGRDVLFIERVAQKSGMHILCSTGFYQEKFHPPYLFDWSEQKIYDFFLRELIYGIDGSPFCASVIAEIASSYQKISHNEEKVFRAAIRAHLETGATLSTHTTLGTMAEEQIQLFLEYTSDLSRIIIGHMDLCEDHDVLRRLLDRGVNIAFDTIGKLHYRSDQERMQTLLALLAEGYGKQLVLSLDITRPSQLKKNGGIGYAYLMETFIPMLREKGLSDSSLELLLLHNPQRIFDQTRKVLI